MDIEEARSKIDAFLLHCREACDAAKKAAKSKKSLAGDNFYGKKFANILIAIAQADAKLKKVKALVAIEQEEVAHSDTWLEIIKSTNAKSSQRVEALKQLRLFYHSELLPRVEGLTADPVPETEQVLPVAVIENTRGYIEKVVLQANGSYEHQWYDACAVMIRRLVETFIIELYEAKGKAEEVQDADGNFLMLRDLVDCISVEKDWNLSRETKRILPLLKNLGDRSAHNRRYLAKKQDIDKVLPGLRVVTDDLLHLAGLK